MLDAIAEVDNLGMEDSTLAADASTTNLDTNAATGESQGSSMQSTDFNQSLMDMLSTLDSSANTTNPSLQIVSGQSLEAALADAIPGLDPTTVTPPPPLAQEVTLSSSEAPADVTNPSLQIVSGQSLEAALADAIPGLDPTTVTPPAPLAQDSSLNPFMAALTELDNPESLGEAFQTVSDGFEGLSNSFEQLATSFLSQDSNNTTPIAANGDDTSDSPDVKNAAIGDTGNDVDTNLDTDKIAIANVNADDINTNVDKVAIANDTDTINTNFGISNLTSGNDNTALGTDFNLDFDALKVNVDQVSHGLQFLVQQLEAAFESDGSALATSSTFSPLS